MRLVDLKECKNEYVGVMAIGFFDCVHLGHRKVISSAVSIAKKRGEMSSVFLFRNNIYSLINQDKVPLFTFEDRVKEIAALGVDLLVYVDADNAFMSLSPKAFLGVLTTSLIISTLVCGTDFSYGKGGVGRATDLLEALPSVELVDLYEINGEKVSSSLVKECLQNGQVERANAMLGRPYSVSSIVSEGRGDGRKMGFPTVNIPLDHTALKRGVYFTETALGERTFKSLTNVGAHPTFSDLSENIETYLLDFEGNLYGQDIEVRFLKYHRDIVVFPDVESLSAQIRADEKERRNYD